MFKIYKIFVLLFIISFSLPADAHVQHYEDLKRIEFDIYRNNKHIGKHTFSFKNLDGQITVESEINFEINPARKASPAPVVSTIFCEEGVSVIPCNPLIYHETGFFPSVIITSGLLGNC